MAVKQKRRVTQAKGRRNFGPKLAESIRVYRELRAAGVPESQAQQIKRAAYFMKPRDFVQIMNEERSRGVGALARRSREFRAKELTVLQKSRVARARPVARRMARRRAA